MEIAYSIEELFSTSRAEEEKRWLDMALVTGLELDEVGHSVAVVGRSGSGKTAQQLSLQLWASEHDILAVEWLPTPPDTKLDSPSQAFIRQALRACLHTIIKNLGQKPGLLNGAFQWVRDDITFLTYHCMQEVHRGIRRHLEPLIESAVSDIQPLLRETLTKPLDKGEEEFVTGVDLLQTLLAVSSQFKYKSIWLLIDNLHRLAYQPNEPDELLKLLLSSLHLLDIPEVVIKLVVPDEMESFIRSSKGVETRRIDVRHLKWTSSDLVKLIERRLMLLTGRSSFKIDEMMPSRYLVPWLEQHALPTPRAWLDKIRPLVKMFQQGGWQVLDKNALDEIRVGLPKLSLGPTEGQVFINGREVKVQPQPYRLLQYLYNERGRVCSRSELYYKALLELPEEPRIKKDRFFEETFEWEAKFNILFGIRIVPL